MKYRKLIAWAVGLGCIIAALGISAIMPDEGRAEDPFPASVQLGERGDGRALSAAITDISFADEAIFGAWEQPGNWLVVEAEIEGNLKENGTLLSHTVLLLDDGRSYRASERVPGSLLRTQLLVGVPQSGALAFELPEDARGSARLQLGANSDPRLDSVIEFSVDLDELPREPRRELPKTAWGSR